MRTGLQPAQVSDLPIFARWMSDASPVAGDHGRPVLDEVDFSDPESVKNAREAIIQMRVWDSIVSWAFEAADEDSGREAIADLVLCQQAVKWQRDNPTKQLAEGLCTGDLHTAQVRLFSLLSLRGADAFTMHHEMTPEGIRYTPRTGLGEADNLLEMAVSVSAIDAVLALPTGVCYAAKVLTGHAAAWRRAQSFNASAMHWELVGGSRQAAEEREGAALAQETAAAAWAEGGRPRDSAATYEKAANNWCAVERHGEAARASQKAAAAWTVACEPGHAARAYEEAAMAWRFSNESAKAAHAYESAVAAYRDAHQVRLAVNARVKAAQTWECAGVPDKAACAFAVALADAGADTLAATQVSIKASTLFHVDLAYEKAWTS